jgi:hypothetical protein
LFALSGEVRERLVETDRETGRRRRVWRQQCRGPGRGVYLGSQSRLLGDERRLRSDTGQSHLRSEELSSYLNDKRGRERIWSSEKESMEDASELSGEEGRGKLRKFTGRSKHPAIRESPNGVTRLEESPVIVH